MNRYGVCWYCSQLSYQPLFVYRAQDKQHPAHMFGAVLIGTEPRWERFRPTDFQMCARVSSSWVTLAIQYTHVPGTKLGLRRMLQHSTWLEREIQRLGYEFTPPQGRIAS